MSPAAAPLPGETLVWSEEFNQSTGPSAPDPKVWTYLSGNGESGGQQIYCAYGETKRPCDSQQPNSYIGTDGYFHIITRKTASGVYTSAFLQTRNLLSFQYGRIEARIKLPAGQGMWPAFWMMGDDINQVSWPMCGEIDIMENIGKQPGRQYGTLHAAGYAQPGHGKWVDPPNGEKLADAFHVYGMIWEAGKIQLYFDSPSNVYAIFTKADLKPGEDWPFDKDKFFFLLNTAVGGDWGGPPDASTRTPAEMLVDYIRVYQGDSSNVKVKQ